MRTIEIPTTLTVEYSVKECKHSSFNGTHKEVFDLSKLSDEGIVQYLAQTLVIKRQSKCRSKTAPEKVKLGTWIVPEPGKVIGITEESIQKTVTKAKNIVHLLTEEQKKELAAAMGFAYVGNTDEDETDNTDEEEEI